MGALNAAALSAFGGEVTYLPQNSQSVTLTAIFQPTRETEETSPGTYAVLFIRRADLGDTPQRGDRVEIADSVYTVFDIESDGEGGVVLKLRRA